ncbi:arylamine N-acetyltransferase family protein [Gracilibacillus sp. D59]|uniref:arylamine N-acetyltransferase family protein n=1 Tax=Gracilibacillus sp. D59 TaxID=3457434 RepID=UPI003FCE6813
MTELNTLFREKIGMPENKKVTFTTLDHILEKTAVAFPFENLCIIANKTEAVTKQNLMDKILVRNEGGLCYELNPLLYFFLVDNGCKVTLIRGEVYNNEKKDWSHLGRTHAAILLEHEGNNYLLDTGFGGNLPLKPVPLNGETVTSRNGDFRVRALQSEYGDYVLEMKLKYKHTEWQIGYAFDSQRLVGNVTELDEISNIIVHTQKSPFNKTPMITQLTSDGNITLTNTSFTQWKHGKSKKEQIDETRFKQLAKQYFGFQDL